jgi:hypothetical protein
MIGVSSTKSVLGIRKKVDMRPRSRKVRRVKARRRRM